MKEKALSIQVQQRLGIYHSTGEVIWWCRLNSLKIKTLMGTWIQGCPRGTPDILALVRNRQDGITALFLELKSDTGKLRPEQEKFYQDYNKKQGIVVMVVTEVRQLNEWINKYAKDFVAFLPSEL